MKTLYTLLPVILFCVQPLALYAQSPPSSQVLQIREIYKEISRMIETCADSKSEVPCTLYCNEWNVNSLNRGNWASMDYYEEKWAYWYDSPPESWDASTKAEQHLRKIEANTRTSLAYIHEEYLYNNGELIFYYSKYLEEGHGQEYRFYFKGNRMIDFIESKSHEEDEAMKSKFDAPLILEHSKKFQEKFNLMMQ